ncbi:DUF3137 domain-containing protein [Candidatus Saccharibacteria bacterium]|nr:DUF3137 domain-containing protein [Candidatus Saccharibacteria bacterium]
MSETNEIDINSLNQLKRESDRWVVAFLVLIAIVFLGPFLFILIAIGSRAFGITRDVGLVSKWLSGSAVLFFLAFLIAFVFFVVVFIMMAKKRSAYRTAYKTYFSHRVLKSLLENYKYDHASGISPAELFNTGMVRLGNRFRSEDFVSGRYKDIGFMQSDLLVEYEYTDSDGDTHTDTYFKGQWLVFEFPRNFAAKLAVVGRGCREFIYPRKMEKFATESTEFNKMFKVFMQDGVEMFYLLDPKMIEAMQALGEKYKGKLSFLFVNHKLHIGLNNGADSFEPPKRLGGEIKEDEEVNRLSEEFKTVFNLIDALELNKKIFK